MISLQLPDSENQGERKRKIAIYYLSQQPFGATENVKTKEDTQHKI